MFDSMTMLDSGTLTGAGNTNKAPTVGVPNANNIVWQDWLKAISSSSGTGGVQPMQLLPLPSPQAENDGQLVSYDLNFPQQQQQQEGDSTSAIVSLLLKYFGLGG